MENTVLNGFSKMSKNEKIRLVCSKFKNSGQAENLLKSFLYNNDEIQQQFDNFSENTLSNFFLPYGIAPNFLINGREYMVPMVIEESSVVAAASLAAKFWKTHGGFHSKVISAIKKGQIHFIFNMDKDELIQSFPKIRNKLKASIVDIAQKMVERGGGIKNIRLIDYTHELENYFCIDIDFLTADSMGANFINSCLERMAIELKNIFNQPSGSENVEIIMAILSNHTPECLVETVASCKITDLDYLKNGTSGKKIAEKFKLAFSIASVNISRAVTHNKGIFNGIDAVAMATGNDYRAIEAAGHAFASLQGYKSLSDVQVTDKEFQIRLTLPLAIGTVGGLTTAHPLAKFSMELLGNPGTEELMQIMSSVGLANNFSAIKSLVTSGIQKGHMKMHLSNMLIRLGANESEKKIITEYFRNKSISFFEVERYLNSLRK